MNPEPKRLDLSLYFGREPVILAVLTGLAVVSFLAVTGLSRLFQAQQDALAVEWSTRGGNDLNAGHYKIAITEFRTALEYARGDDDYQLSLAQALLGLNRTDEAYAYLINLWDRQPENGMVNLELARIAAAKKQTDGALRFYHNAIYSTWPGDRETDRRRARLELIDYLLGINFRTQAESELIALEANSGADAAQQTQLGELFLKVYDNSRALAAFRQSLQQDGHDAHAEAGAGVAAFNLGMYPAAGRYLQQAVAADPGDAASAALLGATRNVLRLDPYRPQITVAERNRIVVDAFNAAGDRLRSCGLLDGAQQLGQPKPDAAPQVPADRMADEWIRLKPQITERGLRSDPDLVNTAMDLTFAIENQKKQQLRRARRGRQGSGAGGEAARGELTLSSQFHPRPGTPVEQQTVAEPGYVPAGSVWSEWYAPASMLQAFFREDRFFLILSVFIGIFSGLAVVCFRYAIDWCGIYVLGSGAVLTPWRLIAAPTAAGLVIAVLTARVFPQARGSGVNQTKAALYIFNGYIPLKTAVGKFITSALAIGSGHSLGPEDPSLQIGACLASALGRKLKLSRDHMRLIAPVGAAAGLAAAFNAPISAVLFVIEEVIGRWTAGILGSVVLSAVSSVVVMRWFMGSESLFRIPPVELKRPSELVAYVVLGIVGGLASVAFSAGIGVLRPCCHKLPRWTQYVQPAVAGLLIGTIAVLGAPQVMGAGYQYIDEAMHGQFTWQFLAILGLLKIVATLLSFVSGTPGGMFAPTLFIGAMFGVAVGGAEHALLPHLSWSPGTYALVGMGVLFAGFLRAPMTSVFMVLEVSGNYSIIVPVIVANTFAYVISRALQPVPIFDTLSRQDGLELPSMEEQREESILRVEDAMQPPPQLVLDAADAMEKIAKQAANTAQDVLLVRLHPGGWSSIARAEIEALVRAGRGGDRLESILEGGGQIPYVHPDQPLDMALRYVDRWPLVPVVNRANLRELEGVITQRDVLERYRDFGGE